LEVFSNFGNGQKHCVLIDFLKKLNNEYK
jgi:hypothetical protein